MKNTDISTLLQVLLVATTFFFLGNWNATRNNENITDQQYKSASLQYMEDIRNALDYIADNQ